MIKYFNDFIIPLYDKIKYKRLISSMNEFADKLVEFSQIYDIVSVGLFAGALKEKIKVFDIENITNLIEQFVEIINIVEGKN